MDRADALMVPLSEIEDFLTKKELQSLIDYSKYAPPMPSDYSAFFDNVQTERYWVSNTIASGTNFAWVIDMYLGTVNIYPKDSSQNIFLWPVRGE